MDRELKKNTRNDLKRSFAQAGTYGLKNRSEEERVAYDEAVFSAKSLIRSGLKAALATFDLTPESAPATPYASLVTTATTLEGAPVLLISSLARHTKNITANPRVSLLFDGTGPSGDLLAGGRVTVIGSLKPTKDPVIEHRFINRHRQSEGYASFPDFSFYEQEVESAHFIGGFGRIHDIDGPDLLVRLEDAQDLIAAEPGIIAHMNNEHTDTLALFATRLLGASEQDGPWAMSGIDPEGIDILGRMKALRLVFPSRVSKPEEAQSIFKDLVTKAREQD